MLAVEMWDAGGSAKKEVSNCGRKVEADSTSGETWPDPVVNPFFKNGCFPAIGQKMPRGRKKSCSPCCFEDFFFFLFVQLCGKEMELRIQLGG